ncbi:hypothetical protein PanWU01x14_152980 [Parasponia andersonii]|uniref:Uncharacterized protein n=1 Tax=Parasponia andersonii TaxID=3476 RepID=A0A2P5CGY5_PARAD|nr:hypothetical protein PanWU01x14_152980 [Parasponia andersonii]
MDVEYVRGLKKQEEQQQHLGLLRWLYPLVLSSFDVRLVAPSTTSSDRIVSASVIGSPVLP